MHLSAPNGQDILLIVRELVARVAEEPHPDPQSIGLGTSLVGDLGIDSLRFVDLTLAIEDAFEFEEFPIQEWADLEATREEQRYTVGSLVEFIFALLQAQT